MTTKTTNMQIQVFDGDFWKGSLIRELLQDHNIYAAMTDEHMSSIDPAILGTQLVNQVALVVSQENYEQARSLIEEFNNAAPEAS
ncbi:hypothetical protein PBAL39_23637 [Pedobacter sp. BAL39]|uniref:putative signal transducing protein n=1 Tax=Pedobacter sp. BAL39 TaxID=391596 RepID=UPI0001559427|nr:DUF2007 domain-containing protein [Pedobacter sp. BAL39]EDM36053.1 hypothetical protein PBAL39_23637 [Pedobacter sp. BAL39]